MTGQPLRRSQFITTYGPGAILEGPNGPRIIPTLSRSELFDQYTPRRFEITDRRLSESLLDGAGILRLPSNAELGIPDYQAIYETSPFPRWSLCVKHDILYKKTISNNYACPKCGPLRDRYEAWRQANRQAIRFVRACPVGHMDDVDWIGIVHHDKARCDNVDFLLWKGGGGALRNIYIICPKCGAGVSLGYAYSREWSCSGRFPEQGRERGDCDETSKIFQRGASNLYIPEIETALTIPPNCTPLHRLLEQSIIQTILISQGYKDKNNFLQTLQGLAERKLLQRKTIVEIKSYPEDILHSTVDDVLNPVTPQDTTDLRLQEFDALRHAASYGIPPVSSPTPGAPPQFEVARDQVRTIKGQYGHCLRVTPVNRLRVVMVQTGYTRRDPLNEPVDRAFVHEQRAWYPGVELFGEGIFIDLHPNSMSDEGESHFSLVGEAAPLWFNAWIDPESFEQNTQLLNRSHLHPVFVWWHTLSHRLIKALAVDSGYSSAAVRERIFIDLDEKTGNATGGVLLYTAQPGGDGTLGGLVALVSQFKRILESALRDLDACSNDPLCSEDVFAPRKHNGAACYACALISETSCEHRNMYLDRNLLLENLP